MRTTPGTCDALSPLEDAIMNEFLPALTSRSAITDQERELLSLPFRLGALGIPDLHQVSILLLPSLPGHLQPCGRPHPKESTGTQKGHIN